MFGPSLKSVPGCLVSIVPMLIGVPVAFTPGFEPHFDVSTEPPPPLELVLAVEPPPPAAELLLELLPQPPRTSNPSTVTSARLRRLRAESWNIRTVSSPDEGLARPVGEAMADTSSRRSCMQQTLYNADERR